MADPNTLIGSTLGHYRLLEAIGEGGMGVVFRAHDERLDRDVALKLLPVTHFDDPSARARLLREARTASQLNHPHICQVFEVGEAESQAYLAMELVRGETLRARVAGGALSPDEVVRIGRQLADALAHAHAQSVVHRDFKSANIVLTPEGRAKVLDFGLAKRMSREALADSVTGAPTITQPGTVAGTLAYMAPEQLRGQPADARSDVWALGVVLHEMATGTLPFGGETGYEISGAILNEPPLPVPGTVPDGLRTVIAHCLQKEPAQRFADGGAALAALQTLVPAGRARWTMRARRMSPRGARLGFLSVLALFGVIGVLVALNVAGVRTRLASRLGVGAPARAIRLAVLPFANLSGDPEQDYLSDGVTQEMIGELGRLHPQSLGVIARTSVMRYKKTKAPIDQIGRELVVDYVLEGSARRDGSRIRISAALVRVPDRTQLWADTFERELAGILALQSEVARKVANALALKLLPAEQARLANVRSVDPDAYEAWLKGTQYRMALTRSGLDNAEKYFTLALEKDPTFAAAWAGLGRVWTHRQQMGLVRPSDAAAKAKAAAFKAVELDETDFEAHRLLAGIYTWTDWDWPAAEREWTRLLELNPNDAETLSSSSHFLLFMGRHAEALARSERALQLDPFSVKVQSFHAIDLVYVRRYDDAIAVARAAQRQQPDAPVAYAALSQALFLKGLHDEAFVLEQRRWAGDPEASDALTRGYAEGGYGGAVTRLADLLAGRMGQQGGVSVLGVAGLYLRGGDVDRALEWLDRAYDERDPNVPGIGMPTWDSLRNDPRFQDVWRRMKLPQPR